MTAPANRAVPQLAPVLEAAITFAERGHYRAPQRRLVLRVGHAEVERLDRIRHKIRAPLRVSRAALARALIAAAIDVFGLDPAPPAVPETAPTK